MLKNLNKRRNLLGTIYAIFMLMPLLSVLVTCIYVQFNKNAYMSYSDELVETQREITNQNEYMVGAYTSIMYKPNSNTNPYGNWFEFSEISLDLPTIFGNDYNPLLDYKWFRVRSGNQFDIGTNVNTNMITKYNYWGIELKEFGFIYQSNNAYQQDVYAGASIQYQYTYTSRKLDNVFDYSISRVTNGNRGNIDFTSTLFSFFLSSNEVNNLYIGFINYYINYTLLVSCIYFLYLVLMWFITFIKNLIFRYMGE